MQLNKDIGFRLERTPQEGMQGALQTVLNDFSSSDVQSS